MKDDESSKWDNDTREGTELTCLRNTGDVGKIVRTS
jgi:hypothetical protein